MGTTSDKLTYLATTKTKIKDAINLGEANITTETFRQYEKKIKQALINTMLDKWGIWDNFEKVTGTNTSLSLSPTSLAPISIDLKGNTQQDSTTGKNLCSPTWTSVEGSITFTKVYDENGNVAYIDVNGTANSVSYINVGIKTYSAGTYVISGSPSGGGNNSYQQRMVSGESALATDNGSGATFTLNSSAECFLRIRIASGYTANHLKFYPMVRLSSTSEGYEPYTNGASPNPTYPQEIHNVSGDNTIVVEAKNKFNPTYAVQTQVNNQEEVQTTNLYTLNQDGSISCSRYSFAQGRIYFTGLKLKAGTYYVKAHVKITNSTNNDISWSARNLHARTDIKPLTTTTLSTGEGDLAFNFTLSEEVESVGISMQCNHQGTITLTNIMLCDEDIPYETYTGQTQLISLGVENLYNGEYEIGDYSQETGAKGTSTNMYRSKDYIPVKPNSTYTFTINNGEILDYNIRYFFYDTNKTFISSTTFKSTFETPNNTYYVNWHSSTMYQRNPNGVSGLQIEKGSKANSYTPYGTIPIELNKIGNYQDYIYKTDKWYLHKEIGKVVLDGSEESWRKIDTYQGISQFEVYENSVLYSNDGVIRTLSNYFKGIPYNNSWSYNYSVTNVYDNRIRFMTSDYSVLNDFTTWLSTHNTIVYYVLSTPQEIEITDSTLIEQLEAIKNMTSYNGTTNISQRNNDLGFILDIKAIKEI